MKKIRLFATLAALMGACGGNPPNQSDTSVTPSPDSGTPAPDAGQSDSPTPMVDSAVGNDAPVVPTDSPSVEDVQRDADMIIAGVGPMITTGAFRCAARLCRNQQVTFQDGVTSTEPYVVTCNASMTEANLTSIGFTSGDGWAVCAGNTCSMPMAGGARLRAIVYPMMNGGECGLCGTVVDIDMSSGMEIPRAEGVRQSCPL